jgi:hypothetical protein
MCSGGSGGVDEYQTTAAAAAATPITIRFTIITGDARMEG